MFHPGTAGLLRSPAITASDDRLLRVSGPLPGSVHDLKAARIWGIIRALAATVRETAPGRRLVRLARARSLRTRGIAMDDPPLSTQINVIANR
jgi:hypothetical protein